MNALEMHIEVNQSLQKVSANLTRKFLTEEIDWVLTKIQDRFIRTCIRPVDLNKHTGRYTFVDQLRADSLKNLVTYVKLPAYGDVSWDKKQKVILPKDYQYLLSDKSNISLICNRTLQQNSTVVPLTKLALKETSAINPPYYIGTATSVTIGSTTLNIPADLGLFNTYTGFQKKQDLTLLVPFILNYFWKAGVEVYWERYAEVYKQNTFIIPNSLGQAMVWDNVAVTSVTTENYTQVTIDRSGEEDLQVDNRLMASEDIPTYTSTPFFKSSSKGIISEMGPGVLYVYRDENCTVNSVIISYIRKPQPISLLLGSNCELSESTHQTICDLAVEYLKKTIEDPQWQIKTQDVEQRIII